MAKYPSDLLTLIASLKKLPGVGSRTAERFAFHMLDWPSAQLEGFAHQVASVKEKIKSCKECGCLSEDKGCFFCSNAQREKTQLCIIASSKDVFALEDTGSYRGLYHVLGGLLSPLEGRHPEHLNLDKLRERIEVFQVKEVILALDSTIEGDATSLYLKEKFQAWGVSVSRLAFGLPMGSALDFVDGGTLARALSGRQTF